MPKKSNKKVIKNEIKTDDKIENERVDLQEIDKAESDFKLLNTKVLKQQQLNYEMSIQNFLKSNGLIILSY